MPEPPSGGSGSFADGGTLADKILDQLRIFGRANAEEIAAVLDIKVNSTSKILGVLYRAGLAEPLPKKNGRDLATYRAVPPERQQAVAAEAARARKKSILTAIRNMDMTMQAWVVNQILTPSVDTAVSERLLSEPCPAAAHTGPCNCEVTNIFVQRHRSHSRGARRTRREATRRRQELKQLNEEYLRAQKEEPAGVQFLEDKKLAREAAHVIAHLTARVEDETELLRTTGVSEWSEASWKEMRNQAEEIRVGIIGLFKAYGVLLDDTGDWVEGTPVDQWGYEEGAAPMGALGDGSSDDDEIWDVEVVNDDDDGDDDRDGDVDGSVEGAE